MQELETLSGRSYETDTVAMRVIADHLRGATFLAVDGVRPSNKAQGYVMRRLIRRAVRYAFDLGLEQNFFPQIIPTVAQMYAADYPEVAERGEAVIATLVKEEQAFRRTLRKGIKQMKAYADNGITGTSGSYEAGTEATDRKLGNTPDMVLSSTSKPLSLRSATSAPLSSRVPRPQTAPSWISAPAIRSSSGR